MCYYSAMSVCLGIFGGDVELNYLKKQKVKLLLTELNDIQEIL